MAIPLVSIEEVQTGRGGKTKGEKYGKYAQSIAKDVAWLKEQIAISPDKKIRLKVRDIANTMGGEFIKKSDTAIYWGLKFVLFHEGIVVDMGTTVKDKSKLLVMKMATPEDKLPPSLAKVLEPPEEEMPEPGSEE